MILYTVIPCYNEEKVLPETIRVMTEKYKDLIEQKRISGESKVLFVDDGSFDDTWEIICDAHKESRIFCGIKLSRNRGHQNALLAGLMEAKEYCDAAISVDADLQDDIDAIDKMVEKFGEGCEIVYGVRNKRSSDRFMKRFTAEGYYRLMLRRNEYGLLDLLCVCLCRVIKNVCRMSLYICLYSVYSRDLLELCLESHRTSVAFYRAKSIH